MDIKKSVFKNVVIENSSSYIIFFSEFSIWIILNKSHSTKKIIHNRRIFKFKQHSNSNMNKWIELLIGIVLLAAAVCCWVVDFWGFGTAALEFFKGGIVWLVILIGLMFLILGISDLRE
jgi:hypothetical protein